MLVFFALGNTKVLSFALANAKVPNASSFALQWNIGFKPMLHYEVFLCCVGNANEMYIQLK